MELIPGASEQSEIGAGYKVFSFRGSGAGGPIGDGMIGYYLDDTPFGIPNFQAAPPIQYFDLERIEVLRGPQGTLYGQGSMGGAIIYHTKNPRSVAVHPRRRGRLIEDGRSRRHELPGGGGGIDAAGHGQARACA